MDFKPIPIGVENFKRIIDGEYYYVDKTLMIKDILDNKSMVNLYTRPRRFGKTLNMSMIQYYFEKAGVTSNDVRFSKAKLENDDRTPEYEIEFYYGAVEYDYSIDAENGKVLEFSSEHN